jgi:hypothetical protein
MLPSRSALAGVVLVVGLIGACNPYQRFGANDDGLGPVDPVNFPAASLGTGGNRKMPGNGALTAVRAFVGPTEVQYFNYPFPPPTPDQDPLRILENDKPYPAVPAPVAYAFGADYHCAPPQDYKYDPRLDEVPLDRQDNIFTALPSATYTAGVASRTSYLPVVSEAVVTGNGLPCQKPKSATALSALVGMAPKPDGVYQAWAIIDPASAVYPVGQTSDTHPGLGLQRWGWFNRYLLAYLDGGAIPTMDTMVMEDDPPVSKKVKRMVTQRIYYPRSMVMGAMSAAPGRLGAGYDVMAAKRGDAAYSPVCAVFTYDAGMPLPAAMLPRDAAMIEATFNTMDAPIRPAATPYIFCLQVQP